MKIIEERAREYHEQKEKHNPNAEAYDYYSAYYRGVQDERERIIEVLMRCAWHEQAVLSRIIKEIGE